MRELSIGVCLPCRSVIHCGKALIVLLVACLSGATLRSLSLVCVRSVLAAEVKVLTKPELAGGYVHREQGQEQKSRQTLQDVDLKRLDSK